MAAEVTRSRAFIEGRSQVESGLQQDISASDCHGFNRKKAFGVVDNFKGKTGMNMEWTALARTFGLFLATAVAELVGCYLPLLWLTGKGTVWLLVPAALSLAVFVWLLALHPLASGRVYATYGAVYIATALGWLWTVDGVTPTWSDYLGVGLALSGAGVIALGSPR